MLLGIWKSYDELEESISLEELSALMEITREKQHEQRRFHAALHGHKIPEPTDARFEEIKRRALEKAGRNVEKEEFGAIGVALKDE